MVLYLWCLGPFRIALSPRQGVDSWTGTTACLSCLAVSPLSYVVPNEIHLEWVLQSVFDLPLEISLL